MAGRGLLGDLPTAAPTAASDAADEEDGDRLLGIEGATGLPTGPPAADGTDEERELPTEGAGDELADDTIASSLSMGEGGMGDRVLVAEVMGKSASLNEPPLRGVDSLGDPAETGVPNGAGPSSRLSEASTMLGLVRTFLAASEAAGVGERSPSAVRPFIGEDMSLAPLMEPSSADLGECLLPVSDSETSSLKGSSMCAGSGVPGEGDRESCPGRPKKRGLLMEPEPLPLFSLILSSDTCTIVVAH